MRHWHGRRKRFQPWPAAPANQERFPPAPEGQSKSTSLCQISSPISYQHPVVHFGRRGPLWITDVGGQLATALKWDRRIKLRESAQKWKIISCCWVYWAAAPWWRRQRGKFLTGGPGCPCLRGTGAFSVWVWRWSWFMMACRSWCQCLIDMSTA